MEKEANQKQLLKERELTEKNVELYVKATGKELLKKAVEISLAFAEINKRMMGLCWWDHAEALCKDYDIKLIQIQKETIKQDGMYVNGLATHDTIKCIPMEDTAGIFSFFHELGHVLLDFREKEWVIIWQSEIGADLFAYSCASTIWPEHQKFFRERFYSNPITGPYLGYLKTIF